DTDTVFTDIIEKNAGNHYNYLVHYHWADYKKWMGQPEEAFNEYSKTIAVNPKGMLGYLRRGEMNEGRGNFDGAIKDYDKAIKLDRTSALAYNNNGWAHFQVNDTKTAILYLDTAISLDGKMAL